MARKVLNGLDLNGQRVQAVGDPSAATDAANKSYVDNVAAGLDWKERVRAASTANMAVATAVINGATMDGVTLVTGDRVLLKNQTAAAENGIYIVAASGAAARASDADSASDITKAIVGIESGTVNADTIWQLITDGPITLGTTNLTFTQFTGGATSYQAGNGLTESPAGTFNVGAGSGISVAADAVSVDTTIPRKFAANCVATTNPQTFNHALNSTDVDVIVKEVATSAIVMADVTVTDANNVSVNFGGAPTAGQYRVLVLG